MARSIALGAFLLAPLATAQQVVHVDIAASGANDGSSWQDAFSGSGGLAAALASIAPGATAEVWVARGTYLPAGPGPAAHFALADGVAIFGGFAGGETSLEQRDLVTNVTVLSGDLLGDDQFVQLAPWQPFEWVHVADNARHLVRASGVGPTARLDGFTLRRGHADGPWHEGDGGGLAKLVGASPIFTDCTFEDGFAGRTGGGVYALGGAPTFLRCTFRRNVALEGGGARFESDVSALLTDCRFEENRGRSGAALAAGHIGPTPSAAAGEVRIVGGTFRGNEADLGAPSGAGVFAARTRLEVERTAFIDNRTHGGGGGAYLFAADATFVACDFVRNEGKGDGGGALYVDGAGHWGESPGRVRVADSRFVGNNGVAVAAFGGRLELVHVTAVANVLTSGANGWPAFVNQAPATTRVRNSIVHGNAPVPGIAGAGAHFVEIAGPGFAVDDSCIEDWDGSLAGSGNFTADPRFVDPSGADGVAGTADDDLGLLPDSPCVDRANSAWEHPTLGVDLGGAPRFVARLDAVAPGTGCAPRADLGCHELSPDGPWSDVPGGVGGGPCTAWLVGAGPLAPGSVARIALADVPPGTFGALGLGVAPLLLPFAGGLIVPDPLVLLTFVADGAGGATWDLPWPLHRPAGLRLWAQAWFLDPGAPFGLGATQGLVGAPR